MDRAVSLKQVFALLSGAAQSLHQVFHSALQVWLQLQEGPQQQKQDPVTKAAVQAVQAALHAASMCSTDDLKLAWMKQHVPTVSTAVTACVVAQSDTRLKRVRVLLQLMTVQDESRKEHLSANMEAETEHCWQTYAACSIAAFFAPLATILKALSGAWNVSSRGSPLKQKQRQQRSNSYRQRDQLLALMAAELVAEHARVAGPMFQLLDNVIAPQVDVYDKSPPGCLQDALCIQLQSSLVWLELALSLPHTDKHDAPQAWLRVVDWEAQAFMAVSMNYLELPVTDERSVYFRQLLCKVLARPDLQDCLDRHNLLSHIAYLLHTYGVQPQQMRDAGVPEAVIQQLAQLLHAPRQIIDAGKGEFEQLTGICKGHAAGASSSRTEGGTGAHDNNPNDMQALLELMYGKLDVK